MKMKQTLATLSVAALTMAGTSFAADEPKSQSDDPWRFGVTVPLWAPQIDGNVTVRGHKEDVNISFDQLKDHLDASFALGLEARKQKFGFSTGVGYMKFSAGNGAVDDELKLLIVDAVGFYQLVRTGENHPFILEATAGIRYWWVKNEVTITDAGGVFNGSREKDLVDPMVGLRGAQFLTPKLHLDFGADIGGFDISDNQSKLDWSAAGMLSYDFTKWFTLSGGYRALGLNVSHGNGEGENGVDLTFHGVMVAAKFTFEPEPRAHRTLISTTMLKTNLTVAD